MQKRVMSLFLVFCILLTILPPPALAAGMDSAETEEDMELVDERVSEIDMETEASETPDSIIAVQFDESMDIGSSVTCNGVHYVVRNRSLYQGNEKIIADDVTWIVLHGNALYWSKKVDTGADIYRKDLISDKETVYYHAFTSVEAFDIYGDSLYYLCNGEMVQADVLSGEERTLFIDHSYIGFYLDEGGNIQGLSAFPENVSVAEDMWNDPMDEEMLASLLAYETNDRHGSDFTSGELAQKLERIIYSGIDGCVSPALPAVGTSFSKKQQYHITYTNTPGDRGFYAWQCAAYAAAVYSYLFGYSTFNEDPDVSITFVDCFVL